MAGQANLQIVIEALNRSNAVLQQVQSDLKATAASTSAVSAATDVATAAHNRFSGALSGIGGSLSSFGSSLQNIQKQWLGVGSAVAGAAAAFTAANFVKSAISDTEALGESTRKLQLITGDTAPAASQLLHVFSEMGLDADTASTMLGRFSKNMFAIQVANEDGSKPAKTTAQLLKDIGVSALDSSGKLKPTTDLLGQVADRFQAMHNPALESATAIALFGRSGIAMLPMLDMGSKGMAQMEAEADKLGVTLSQSNVNDIHQAVLAQREFSAALEGIKLKIGTALLPVLTALSLWFVTHQKDIISFAGSVRDNLVQAFNAVAPVVQPMIAALTALTAHLSKQDIGAIAVAIGTATVAMLAFAAASLAASLVNPFTATILGMALVIAGITVVVRHWDEIWAEMQAAPGQLLDYVRDNWGKAIIDVILGPLGLVLTNWGAIFDAMPAPVQKAMNLVASIISDAVNIIIFQINAIPIAFQAMVNAIGAGIEKLHEAAPHGAKSLLDSIGLSNETAAALQNFQVPTLGKVDLTRTVSGGGPAGTQDMTGQVADIEQQGAAAQAAKNTAGALQYLAAQANDATASLGGDSSGGGTSGKGAGGALKSVASTAKQVVSPLVELRDAYLKSGLSVADFVARLHGFVSANAEALQGLADAFAKFKGTLAQFVDALHGFTQQLIDDVQKRANQLGKTLFIHSYGEGTGYVDPSGTRHTGQTIDQNPNGPTGTDTKKVGPDNVGYGLGNNGTTNNFHGTVNITTTQSVTKTLADLGSMVR